MHISELNKREFIALEVLKTYLATQSADEAIQNAFITADKFITASSVTLAAKEKEIVTTTSQSATSPSQENLASQKSVSFPIFNHDHPKTSREK